MSHRLFVGIRPPQAIRAALIEMQGGVMAARWQDDDQFHLTLRFAGEVEPRMADDLCDALRTIRMPAFPLALRGVGHFEKKGVPHTLWAGVTPSQPLIELQRKVERACQSIGLKPESRNFAPHITLARLNAASGPVGGFLTDNARFQGASWNVEEFALFESQLTHPGALYSLIETYPLRRSADTPSRLASETRTYDTE